MSKNEKLTVIIEVSGGVAECTSCPEGVEVIIIDHDNEEEEEATGTCPTAKTQCESQSLIWRK